MDRPDRDLTLPSGATVRWRDIDELFGADEEDFVELSWKIASQAQPTQADTVRAGTCVLIESWNVPYLPEGTPMPRQDPKVLRLLRQRDYRALYRAGRDMTTAAFSEPDEDAAAVGDVGSPTGPGTDSEPN